MNLTKNERQVFMKVVAALVEKLLNAPYAPQVNSGKKRIRRTRAEASKLRRRIKAARKANKPVKVIAQELGVTPAYVYQIAHKPAASRQGQTI